MDIDEYAELSREAGIHHIKHKPVRLGSGEDFEYAIDFGKGLSFKNARAADKFITAIIQEYKLTPAVKYRLPFGWEV